MLTFIFRGAPKAEVAFLVLLLEPPALHVTLTQLLASTSFSVALASSLQPTGTITINSSSENAHTNAAGTHHTQFPNYHHNTCFCTYTLRTLFYLKIPQNLNKTTLFQFLPIICLSTPPLGLHNSFTNNTLHIRLNFTRAE